VLCSSVSADRGGVAASSVLATAAASVILWSFEADSRKSYWRGCIKVAMVTVPYTGFIPF